MEENPEKTSSDEQGTSPARSYDCTFCKRGFSNAQALGGHMNIHRRDKAKLIKQEADQNTQQQYLPSYSPNHSKDKNIPTNWPWNDDDDDKTKARNTIGSEIRQLPLFDEKPSDQNPRNQVREGIEKGFPSSQGSELDLELRLGLEPAQDSTPSRTTKKFF